MRPSLQLKNPQRKPKEIGARATSRLLAIPGEMGNLFFQSGHAARQNRSSFERGLGRMGFLT